MLFVIVGFGFKISAVPFHFWAPDTYEGAPVPVTAFLSVASKAAGFAGLLQVCFVAFEPLANVWAPVLGVIAVGTMSLGNLTALQQRNIVRLLGYSSIATAGYILLPFGLVQPGMGQLNSAAFQAVLVYLLAYSVMNTGAFAVVTAVTRRHPTRQLADYAGLGSRSGPLALAMTAFLVSLTGIPPLVGWIAKLYILQATMTQPRGYSIFLAVAVVVNSVVGAFYYLRVARTMWMDEPPATDRIRPGFALGLAIMGLAVLALITGIIPAFFSDWAGVSTLVATGA